MKPRKNNLNLCTVLRESLWLFIPTSPSLATLSLHFLYFTTQDIKFNLHVCVCVPRLPLSVSYSYKRRVRNLRGTVRGWGAWQLQGLSGQWRPVVLFKELLKMLN